MNPVWHWGRSQKSIWRWKAFAAAVLQSGPDTPTYGVAAGAAELALIPREEFPALRDLLLTELDRYRELLGGSADAA